jgi:hypothetical protein
MEILPFISLVLLAVCLSAACGLRVFMPPFFLGLAAHFGLIEMNEGLAWLSNGTALTILGVATLVELTAFYIPFIDNLLDSIASPLAIMAGVLLTSSLLSNYDPAIKWTVAGIAGGGASSIVQGGSVAMRAVSSGTTIGFGNFIVATVETVASFLISLLSILLPIMGFLLVGALFYFSYRAFKAAKIFAADTPPK